jgi:predicted GTPase
MNGTHSDGYDVTEQLKHIVDEIQLQLNGPDPVNILIGGMTGVGKSTLINAVFGEELAETGRGRPVTQRAEWITSDGFPIRLLDTKGLEAKDHQKTLADLTARSNAHARRMTKMSSFTSPGSASANQVRAFSQRKLT